MKGMGLRAMLGFAQPYRTSLAVSALLMVAESGVALADRVVRLEAGCFADERQPIP